MPARPPDNDCHSLQSLSGVVAKVMQGTAIRRIATYAGEKCGLVLVKVGMFLAAIGFVFYYQDG